MTSLVPNREISPLEFIRLNCFPLKDYELGKIYDYHVKIIETLHATQGFVRLHQNELETYDDYDRIKRRASEFSSRFSRNHLYPLQRNLDQIKDYFDCVKTGKNTGWLKKQLTVTYQTALQALQLYLTYISSARNMQVTDKLIDLVTSIQSLNTTCRTILIPVIERLGSEKEDILDTTCNKLMEYLKTPKNQAPGSKLQVQPIRKKPIAKKPPANPFYMYEGKLSRWKKKSEMLAKMGREGKKKREEGTQNDNESKLLLIESNQSIEIPEKRDKLVRKVSGKVLKDKDIATVVESISCEDIQNKPLKSQVKETVEEVLKDLYEENSSTLKKLLQPKVEEPQNVKLCIVKSKQAEKNHTIIKSNPEWIERLKHTKINRELLISKNKNYKLIEGQKPWDFIQRIGDEIYEEYVTDVTSELEIDETLLDELFINELEEEVNNYITK